MQAKGREEQRKRFRFRKREGGGWPKGVFFFGKKDVGRRVGRRDQCANVWGTENGWGQVDLWGGGGKEVFGELQTLSDLP